MRDRVVALAIAGGLVVGAAGAAAVAFTGGGGGPSLPRLPVAVPAVSHAPAGRVPTHLVLPTRARAYRLRNRADAARVMLLASVLGADGPAHHGAGGWTVGSEPRQLRVFDFPGLPWRFGRLAPEVIGCPATPCPSGRFCAQVCAKPEPLTATAARATAADAVGVARRVAAVTGLAVARTDVRQPPDLPATVRIEPLAGGIPTVGLDLAVVVGADRQVAYAQGYLGAPVALDRYPLVGVKDALRRLHARQGLAAARVTRATLVLLASRGRLVPAFLFDTSAGVVPVVAVEARYLAK